VISEIVETVNLIAVVATSNPAMVARLAFDLVSLLRDKEDNVGNFEAVHALAAGLAAARANAIQEYARNRSKHDNDVTPKVETKR